MVAHQSNSVLIYKTSRQKLRRTLFGPTEYAFVFGIGVRDNLEYPPQRRKFSLLQSTARRPWEKSARFRDYIRFESRLVMSLAGSENLFLYIYQCRRNREQVDLLTKRKDLAYTILGKGKISPVVLVPQTEEAFEAIRNEVWWDEAFWGIVGRGLTAENPFLPGKTIEEHWFWNHLGKFEFLIRFWVEAPALEIWTQEPRIITIEKLALESARQFSMVIAKV